jgi:hypothetical protein
LDTIRMASGRSCVIIREGMIEIIGLAHAQSLDFNPPGRERRPPRRDSAVSCPALPGRSAAWGSPPMWRALL